MKRTTYLTGICLIGTLKLAGCASTTTTISRQPVWTSRSAVAGASNHAPAHVSTLSGMTPPVVPPSDIQQVSADLASDKRPAYAQLTTLPIDLPTVMRLVNEKSPAIGYARARVDEAQARLDKAEMQWLPHLSIGAAFARFDGQTQNQSGNVFGVSRSNLFGAVVPALTLDIADAIYRPLIERQLNSAEINAVQATQLASETEAVAAYIDLLQIHAQLEINVETLKNAETLHTAAKNARDTKLDRTAGDVNRAQTEVLFRRIERIELQGKAAIASARLGKLLLLEPQLQLVPADKVVMPVTLVPATSTLDELLAQALASRPDLASHRDRIQAAWSRVRQAEQGPLLPKIAITNQTGAFGGGINDGMDNFSSRNALSVQLYWEIRNLGFGNRADAEERRAIRDQAEYQLVESQARAVAEIVEAAQIAAARQESLKLAEEAVKEATELYRINMESMTNVIDAKNLVDALRPLQALQALNQARFSYLGAILDFNRAQFRLYSALGQPPSLGIAEKK
jgi:outer membrane protein TolC